MQLTFPLLYVLFGRKSFEVHTYRVESYGFSSSLGLLEYLHNLFSVILLGDLSLLSHSCVSVWTHNYTLVINQYYFTEMLKLFQLWSAGALSEAPVTYLHQCVIVVSLVFEHFLSSDTTGYHRLLGYISCLTPKISHFSRKLWFLLKENSIGYQDPDPRYACCYWGISSRPSQLTEQRNTCVYLTHVQ